MKWARGDIDDVDGEIGKFGRECRGEIVAAGFNQHQVEIGKFLPHIGDRGKVGGGVFANCGMRAAAGLDAGDALGREWA
jgi:hypothetical protein